MKTRFFIAFMLVASVVLTSIACTSNEATTQPTTTTPMTVTTDKPTTTTPTTTTAATTPITTTTTAITKVDLPAGVTWITAEDLHEMILNDDDWRDTIRPVDARDIDDWDDARIPSADIFPI